MLFQARETAFFEPGSGGSLELLTETMDFFRQAAEQFAAFENDDKHQQVALFAAV